MTKSQKTDYHINHILTPVHDGRASRILNQFFNYISLLTYTSVVYFNLNSEIERAKNYLIGRNDISLQRNSAINARISQGTFFGLGPEEPFEFSSKIRSVSLDEVNHVISKYLKNSNKVIVAFQPS